LKNLNWTLLPYTGPADQTIMTRLVETDTDSSLHLRDLPYRFSSDALIDPENTRLWFDNTGQLVAWAVMQVPFWTIDYALAPASPSTLHRQVLAWADNRARILLDTSNGHPCWFINVFPDQTQRIQDLEASGFRDQSNVGEDSWSKILMHRPPDLPLQEFRIPTGFTIRPLQGETEVLAYVEVHRTVFESKSMTTTWRSRTLLHPSYQPEFDLVAISPDGRLAAFCIGWLHRSPGGAFTAQIEPLGCHPDFRRYALGRLLLVEALRRLISASVCAIYVETDNYRSTAFALYESLGFKGFRDVCIFRKNYGVIDG
jgi:mycothiol synthase